MCAKLQKESPSRHICHYGSWERVLRVATRDTGVPCYRPAISRLFISPLTMGSRTGASPSAKSQHSCEDKCSEVVRTTGPAHCALSVWCRPAHASPRSRIGNLPVYAPPTAANWLSPQPRPTSRSISGDVDAVGGFYVCGVPESALFGAAVRARCGFPELGFCRW